MSDYNYQHLGDDDELSEQIHEKFDKNEMDEIDDIIEPIREDDEDFDAPEMQVQPHTSLQPHFPNSPEHTWTVRPNHPRYKREKRKHKHRKKEQFESNKEKPYILVEKEDKNNQWLLLIVVAITLVLAFWLLTKTNKGSSPQYIQKSW